MVVKEFIQMRRDRMTFGMMVGIPLLQLTSVRLCHQLRSWAYPPIDRAISPMTAHK